MSAWAIAAGVLLVVIVLNLVALINVWRETRTRQRRLDAQHVDEPSNVVVLDHSDWGFRGWAE